MCFQAEVRCREITRCCDRQQDARIVQRSHDSPDCRSAVDSRAPSRDHRATVNELRCRLPDQRGEPLGAADYSEHQLVGKNGRTVSLNFVPADGGEIELKAVIEVPVYGRFFAEGASAVRPDSYAPVANRRYSIILPMRDGTAGTPQGDGFIMGRITARGHARPLANTPIRLTT